MISWIHRSTSMHGRSAAARTIFWWFVEFVQQHGKLILAIYAGIHGVGYANVKYFRIVELLFQRMNSEPHHI